MRKFFARWYRIGSRIYALATKTKGLAMKLVGFFVLVGGGTAVWARTAGKQWATADWTHLAFIYAALIIVACLCVLYQDEVEREKGAEVKGFSTIFQGGIGYGRENAFGSTPQGQHGLYAELVVKEDKDVPQEVRIYTSAPILPQSLPQYPAIKSVRQECVIFYPGNHPLPKGKVFKFNFYSHSPIRLVRVHMTKLGDPEEA